MMVEPALALAAMTAERRVICPLPAPPEITPVAVFTLLPPLTGKSLVLLTVKVLARTPGAALNRIKAQMDSLVLMSMGLSSFGITLFASVITGVDVFKLVRF